MHFPEWYMLLFHPLFWAALAIAILGGIGLVAYAIWREKRKSRSDLTPFIGLNHTPHQENLHFFGCLSSTEMKCSELPKELEMDTLYCVTVKPLA